LPFVVPHVVVPQNGPIVIDFENLTTAGPGQGGQVVLTDQYGYRGVTFNRVFAFDYSKGQPIPGFAHSGTRAIEQCYALEFCTEPIGATFAVLQTRVRVWVGYSARHSAGTVVLAALDESGQTIDRRATPIAASASPQPIAESMEISCPTARIHAIEVSAQGGLGASGIAVDDLEFDNSVTAPPDAVAPGSAPAVAPVPTPNDVPVSPPDVSPAPGASLDFALGTPAVEDRGERGRWITVPLQVSGASSAPSTLVATSMAWSGPLVTGVPTESPGSSVISVPLPGGIAPGVYTVSLAINVPAVQPEANLVNNSATVTVEIPRQSTDGGIWWLVLGGVVLVGVAGSLVVRGAKRRSAPGPRAPRVVLQPNADPGRSRMSGGHHVATDLVIRLRAQPGIGVEKVRTTNEKAR
jgi:hypothetical protein